MGIWGTANSGLEQGDILDACWIPKFPSTFDGVNSFEARLECHRVIVVNHSCDLEKLPDTGAILVLPLWRRSEYSKENGKTDWNQVVKLRVRHLFLFNDPIPGDTEHSCVNFRMLSSLPAVYVRSRFAALRSVPRLKSPDRECFSNHLGQFISKPTASGDAPSF